jgi:hypothetical protein
LQFSWQGEGKQNDSRSDHIFLGLSQITDNPEQVLFTDRDRATVNDKVVHLPRYSVG